MLSLDLCGVPLHLTSGFFLDFTILFSLEQTRETGLVKTCWAATVETLFIIVHCHHLYISLGDQNLAHIVQSASCAIRLSSTRIDLVFHTRLKQFVAVPSMTIFYHIFGFLLWGPFESADQAETWRGWSASLKGFLVIFPQIFCFIW